jgi:hypothetical protein
MLKKKAKALTAEDAEERLRKSELDIGERDFACGAGVRGFDVIRDWRSTKREASNARTMAPPHV